jgi:hypothetical protein
LNQSLAITAMSLLMAGVVNQRQQTLGVTVFGNMATNARRCVLTEDGAVFHNAISLVVVTIEIAVHLIGMEP